MGHKIIIVFSGIIALISVYLVYMALSMGDKSGAFLFASFAVLFGVPLLAALTNISKKHRTVASPGGMEENLQTGVRFVPHWQMMTIIVIAISVVLLAILLTLLK